ncbi:MAG: TetR/AcrR family transcriptional regulator [Propionibacteriaceae bacterium]
MTSDYHHGHLRQAVLERAVEVIGIEGPGSFSLRSLAADLGVSHTAPRHHFGSRKGVLTAVAAEGFRLLAGQLESARITGGLLEAGVAYVEFARDHPAHFEVMFSPKLYDEQDADLVAARQVTFAQLRGGVESMADLRPSEDTAASIVAAWAIVHGIATLALTGNLDDAELAPLIAGGDLLAITRRSAALLYPGPPAGIEPEPPR